MRRLFLAYLSALLAVASVATQRGIAQAQRIALQGRDPAGSLPVLLGVEAFEVWRNRADVAAWHGLMRSFSRPRSTT